MRRLLRWREPCEKGNTPLTVVMAVRESNLAYEDRSIRCHAKE